MDSNKWDSLVFGDATKKGVSSMGLTDYATLLLTGYNVAKLLTPDKTPGKGMARWMAEYADEASARISANTARANMEIEGRQRMEATKAYESAKALGLGESIANRVRQNTYAAGVVARANAISALRQAELAGKQGVRGAMDAYLAGANKLTQLTTASNLRRAGMGLGAIGGVLGATTSTLLGKPATDQPKPVIEAPKVMQLETTQGTTPEKDLYLNPDMRAEQES